MKYTIETTKDGFRIEAEVEESSPFRSLGARAITLSGGHDALEALYAEAERTWHLLREQYAMQLFERIDTARGARGKEPY